MVFISGLSTGGNVWDLVVEGLVGTCRSVTFDNRGVGQSSAPRAEYTIDQMAADGEDYAIVDLPLTRHDGEVHRYYQTLHHKPIVGGWDHRVADGAFDFMAANPLLAPWIGVEQPGVPLPLHTALAGLSGANVRYIVIHKPQFANVPENMRALLGTLEPVYEDWSILVLPTEDTSGQGYNVVREYTGHGIGQRMHEDPQVPNHGQPGTGVLLRKGMTIALEPMVLMGDARVRVLDDHWTVVSRDGKLTAHFEHDIVITDGDAEILSRL